MVGNVSFVYNSSVVIFLARVGDCQWWYACFCLHATFNT